MKNKCLNCVFKVIKYFLTISMPFFSAWIGVKAFYFYNVFEKIISDDDLARDVGITVYIAIAEILLNKGLNLLLEKCVKKQEIKFVFYSPESEPIIENNPLIRINGEFPTKINAQISVSAYRKKCKKMKLIVPAAKFYTMQLEKPNSIASINDSGSLVINVEELFSEQKYINTRLNFVILFIKNEAGESKSDLETEIVNDSVFTDFMSNKAVIEIR